MFAGSIAGVSAAVATNGIISRTGKAKRKIRAKRIANARLRDPSLQERRGRLATKTAVARAVRRTQEWLCNKFVTYEPRMDAKIEPRMDTNREHESGRVRLLPSRFVAPLSRIISSSFQFQPDMLHQCKFILRVHFLATTPHERSEKRLVAT